MKLWFFRTPESRYGLSSCELDEDDMRGYDDSHSGDKGAQSDRIYLGPTHPRGLLPLKLGECIPVELVPAAKKKKARKTK